MSRTQEEIAEYLQLHPLLGEISKTIKKGEGFSETDNVSCSVCGHIGKAQRHAPDCAFKAAWDAFGKWWVEGEAA
jgi:hypothetical protein